MPVNVVLMVLGSFRVDGLSTAAMVISSSFWTLRCIQAALSALDVGGVRCLRLFLGLGRGSRFILMLEAKKNNEMVA